MTEEKQEKALTEIRNELIKKKSKYSEPSLSEQVELDELAFYLDVVSSSYDDLRVVKGYEEKLLNIDLSKDASTRLLDIKEGRKMAYSFLETLDIDTPAKYTADDVRKAFEKRS